MKHNLKFTKGDDTTLNGSLGLKPDTIEKLESKVLEALVVGGFSAEGVFVQHAVTKVLAEYEDSWKATRPEDHYAIGLAVGMAFNRAEKIRTIFQENQRRRNPFEEMFG